MLLTFEQILNESVLRGGSKIYYHGSDQLFKSFKTKDDFLDFDYYGQKGLKMIFITTSYNFAEYYIARKVDKLPVTGYIYEVRLKRSPNVFNWNNKEEREEIAITADEIGKKEPGFHQRKWNAFKSESWFKIETPPVLRAIKKLGLEGFKSSEMGETTIGLFDASILEIADVKQTLIKEMISPKYKGK
jgi:hypothetical protein